MAVCDPSQNPSPPAGTIAWAQSGKRLTPAIRAVAVQLANDLSVPIGTVVKKWIDGVPCVFFVSCHPFTINPDGSQTAGAYHGAEVRYPTDLSIMPAQGGAPIGAAAGGKTDWIAVGTSALAIVGVSVMFMWMLHHAGRATRRPVLHEPYRR